MRAQALPQRHAEGVAVGHRFALVVDAARQLRTQFGQRRLHEGRFGRRRRLPVAFGIRARHGGVEDFFRAVHHQLAGVAPVEIGQRQHQFQLRHGVAAQFAQLQQLGGGAAVAGGVAVAQEAGQPAPLAQVGFGTETQRAVLLEHPLQCFQRHAGVRQRGHIAVAELAAVAVARCAAHGGGALQQRDAIAGFQQPPGGCQAHHAAADHHYLLCILLCTLLHLENRLMKMFQSVAAGPASFQ